jgi:mono/diheme cytochrome c family protein
MMFFMMKQLLIGMCAFTVCLMAADDKVERGRYLVEEVGKCQACHTPAGENGELDRSQWLKGATLNFAPTNATPKWHKTAPDITGSSRLFERWKDEGVLNFMTTGLNPRGGKADPPMPTYKLSKEDAEAVVAYLKSLK